MVAKSENPHWPSPTLLLFLALGLYAVANLVTVYLAAIGALGPSLPLLEVLAFVLPVLCSALVLVIQLGITPRPFHPVALAAFLAAMMVAAFLNGLAVIAASSAV
jgi:hypothetical protein